MGAPDPNIKHIYEKANGVVYAREFGADPSTRTEIGCNYDPRTYDGRPLHDHIKEDKMWSEIRRMSRTNSSLQRALEQCIILYQLIKNNGNNKET